MELQPYRQRVVDEARELDEKRRKLMEFIISPAFKTVDPAEQNRLRLQEGYMKRYSSILRQRITAFNQ